MGEGDHAQVLTPRSCITSLTISGETLISLAIASCPAIIALRASAVYAAVASSNFTLWLSIIWRDFTCSAAVAAR